MKSVILFTAVGVIEPGGPTISMSSVVNVWANMALSKVRKTRSVGPKTSPIGLAITIRGPARLGVFTAEKASTIPPVRVLNSRSGSVFTVDSTRLTSQSGDWSGKSPARSDTVPET